MVQRTYIADGASVHWWHPAGLTGYWCPGLTVLADSTGLSLKSLSVFQKYLHASFSASTFPLLGHLFSGISFSFQTCEYLLNPFPPAHAEGISVVEHQAKSHQEA